MQSYFFGIFTPQKLLLVHFEMIPQEFVDEVNDRVDLVSLISSFIPGGLIKKGADNYEACCPFHEEKTPSFTVTPRKKFYHCFGCGAHGNAVRFLMEHQNLPFPEALRYAAQHAGMQVPKPDKPEKTEKEKEDAARYMRARNVLDVAQKIYIDCLRSNKEAMDYLMIDRGLSAETIERFGIGYSPNKWDTITGLRSFDVSAVDDSGMSTKSDRSSSKYDRFRDRIMIPIKYKDYVVGFGGRSLHGQEPKYLNSPETIVFKKGSVLYGLSEAIEDIRAVDRVFVVEGYLDTIALSQHGVRNVVATLGTAVTEGQIKRLFSLCHHVTFCMDGDNAGRNAAWRVAENILSQMGGQHRVDFMFLPDGQDPDDFIRSEGQDAFEQAANHARTLTEYILTIQKRSLNMKNAESIAGFVSTVNDMAMKIPDGSLRVAFQKQIAESAGMSLETMLDSLKDPNSAEAHAQSPGQHGDSQNISVAAKILALAAMSKPGFMSSIDLVYLSRFLGKEDREMLLPLLAYVKSNPGADIQTLLASLSFNVHAKVIRALADAAHTPGNDYAGDADIILDGFVRMESIWRTVQNNQAICK